MRGMFDRVDAFVRDVRDLQSEEALAAALGEIARELGFRYFALTHHVDLRASSAAIRLHNYPAGYPTRAREDVDEREVIEVGSIETESYGLHISAGPSELDWWIEQADLIDLGLVNQER